jgi:hypothetical protein
MRKDQNSSMNLENFPQFSSPYRDEPDYDVLTMAQPSRPPALHFVKWLCVSPFAKSPMFVTQKNAPSHKKLYHEKKLHCAPFNLITQYFFLLSFDNTHLLPVRKRIETCQPTICPLDGYSLHDLVGERFFRPLVSRFSFHRTRICRENR